MMTWIIQHHLYLPLLLLCGTAIVWWAANNSDIDPGPPNARVG